MISTGNQTRFARMVAQRFTHYATAASVSQKINRELRDLEMNLEIKVRRKKAAESGVIKNLKN